MMPNWNIGDTVRCSAKDFLSSFGISTGRLYEVVAMDRDFTYIKKNDRGRNYKQGFSGNGFFHYRFEKVETFKPEEVQFLAKLKKDFPNFEKEDE